ncbi:hypothetical protein ARMGADRAFT_1015726 [Armillaria gallica]|uniref:Uncharacterized protein n=1 Tax=Armillaria gallica TaxID=47427 RepID=A0A2H3DIY1_ARMGA|nr:hypothetical protein ARMGADRAFT_1015726 [Armillaria gallica]
MSTSTFTDFISAHVLLKVALSCLVGPLRVLLSLPLWYMTRTSISRQCTVSDIEVCHFSLSRLYRLYREMSFNVKESTSRTSDIFLTPIDSLKSYPLNPNPSPSPLSLWQAADQMQALQRHKTPTDNLA